MLQIEFLAIRQDRCGFRVEPAVIGDVKIEREPVGEIDEILVLHHPPGNVGLQPVIAAGEVGPRIVNAIRHRPGSGCTGCKIAIPQGAQGFTDSLFVWVEPVEHQ